KPQASGRKAVEATKLEAEPQAGDGAAFVRQLEGDVQRVQVIRSIGEVDDPEADFHLALPETVAGPQVELPEIIDVRRASVEFLGSPDCFALAEEAAWMRVNGGEVQPMQQRFLMATRVEAGHVAQFREGFG